jgi:hypothetical protein
MLTGLRSFPIIGCNRGAKIMQLSETSMGYISPAGVIELIDNKRWYQMKFLAEITKKEQFSKLKNFIIILAPTVIIIIMLFWLGAAIYFSIKADSAAIAKLTELTNTITAIVKARGIT